MKRLSVFLILCLSACGGSSGSDPITENVETETLAEEVAVETAPAVEETAEEAVEEFDPAESNPIVSTQFFGENGNIWKPAADEHSSGAGLLVVLLSGIFTEQFDSCEVRTRSGQTAQMLCVNDQPWTQRPYSCFSNPDANGWRQTWRATFPCDQAGEVRVLCRSFNQEVTFTVPAAARGAVCSRFG